MQTCDGAAGCCSAGDGFECAPAGVLALGEPCAEVTACEPGLGCTNGALVGGCPHDAAGCCNPICDLDLELAEQGGAEPESCSPAFDEGRAPDGRDHVGDCVLPA